MARHLNPLVAMELIQEILYAVEKAQRGAIKMRDNCVFSQGVIVKNSSFAFMEEDTSHVYTGQFDLCFERGF